MLRFLLLITFAFKAYASAIPLANDLYQDAKDNNLPILIMFSVDDCLYCEKIKKDFLEPAVNIGIYKDKVIIRNINNSSNKVINFFDNRNITTDAIAERYNVNFYPTIVLVDTNGRRLAHKIVGIANEEYYWYELDRLVEIGSRRFNARLVNYGK